jgi:inhibitor of KinA
MRIAAPIRIMPLGDSALVVELGERVDELTHGRVQAALRLLESPPLAGVTEVVPAFTTITLFYDPRLLAKEATPAAVLLSRLSDSVRSRLRALPGAVKPEPGRNLEIPVCYGGPFGPDLEQVALQTRLTPEEVVRRHTGAVYLVYMIGFSPGFPYLGGLPESLAVPRRPSARTRVPPGSVGIANSQSCIYPTATPGGWNLIGRTPLQLFRLDAEPPSLLRAGDRVRFRAITPDELARSGSKQA